MMIMTCSSCGNEIGFTDGECYVICDKCDKCGKSFNAFSVPLLSPFQRKVWRKFNFDKKVVTTIAREEKVSDRIIDICLATVKRKLGIV